MKLHKDGTLEGTPQEIAEYNRLMARKDNDGLNPGQFLKTAAGATMIWNGPNAYTNN